MAVIILLMTSCSHRMVGTWTVQRYETTTPGKQAVSLYNIGTMQFKENGKGEKNLNYTVLGITRDDKLPFQWSWSDGKYISIEIKILTFLKPGFLWKIKNVSKNGNLRMEQITFRL